MKKEMIDFVSFYRRFNNVAGRQSFSTLYTAINVLAGHYTS
jgi:photosystem II Psb27 protein